MTKRWRTMGVGLAAALALTAMPVAVQGEVLFDGPARAFWQEQAVLVYGEPVEGAINNQTFSQAWALQTGAADRIRVRVERLEGNLIPDVSLQDATGSVLARSQADDTRALAVIRDHKLPGPGTYQVVVGRDRGETGETSGTYRLTVEVLGTGTDHPNNTAISGIVELGTSVSGELTPEHWRHVYTLDGVLGDLIQISASRQSGTLLPRVELQDANGQSLGTGNVDEQGVTARLGPFELRAAGQFRVLVYRDRGIDGDTAGAYELTVTLLGSGENSARLAIPPNALEAYDVAVQGAISNERWYEDWQFTASAADLITIVAARLPGPTNTLRPQVFLLGGAAQELARTNPDSTGAAATLERFKLPSPGTYTVRVVRDRGKAGVTSGQYELRITLVGAGEGSPTLAATSGAIQTGAPVEGEITNARWADTWTYSGQAGEVVDIIVTRTEGTLIPRIDILDANRQPLRNAQPSLTADTAILQRYQLPASAGYYVVVSRDKGQQGATAGTYSLVVKPSE